MLLYSHLRGECKTLAYPGNLAKKERETFDARNSSTLHQASVSAKFLHSLSSKEAFSAEDEVIELREAVRTVASSNYVWL